MRLEQFECRSTQCDRVDLIGFIELLAKSWRLNSLIRKFMHSLVFSSAAEIIAQQFSEITWPIPKPHTVASLGRSFSLCCCPLLLDHSYRNMAMSKYLNVVVALCFYWAHWKPKSCSDNKDSFTQMLINPPAAVLLLCSELMDWSVFHFKAVSMKSLCQGLSFYKVRTCVGAVVNSMFSIWQMDSRHSSSLICLDTGFNIWSKAPLNSIYDHVYWV